MAAHADEDAPKPAFGTKVPSPRNAKLRPSPPSTSEPIVTSAPTERKLTISSVADAEVLMTSVALSVSTEPSVIFSVSARKMKPHLAALELQPQADGLGVRHAWAMSGSPEVRSVMMADTGFPAELAPPEATKMVPSNTTARRR